MVDKRWVVAEAAPQDWQNKFPELPSIIRQLLWRRGLRTQEAIDEFLNPDYADLHDPFLFKDMEKAVERVFAAIEKKEKIAIYGDYDADGVTGSVILETTLKALGAEISEVHLPHREKEGYGLNKEAVNHLVAIGSKIIITCDCGIANFDEVQMAHEQGVDVIITDHHHVPDKVPPAYAILHPLVKDCGYLYQGLTGGGVAFKFAQGLVKSTKGQLVNGFEKWLLDVVAISTVADVGKLIGENRTLVKYGLVVLKKTRRLGLKKLYEIAGIRPELIDTWSVAFQITPRINAAGRMNHANVAYKLLMSEDETTAVALAQELNQANQDRQKETERILTEAKKQILSQQNQYLLTAFSEKWPLGILGLAAGKLVEEYKKPVILACENGGGEIVGSARSVEQFNIIEAFDSIKDVLSKYGGHPKAAGFTVKDFDGWQIMREKLVKLAKDKLQGIDLRPTLEIDASIKISEISVDLWQSLQAMEPFGEGNPRPKFLAKNLEVVGVSQVGNGGKHLRLTVTDATRAPRKMIGFCFGDWCERLVAGHKIDVVFELGMNEWQGEQELQLKIVDLKFTA